LAEGKAVGLAYPSRPQAEGGYLLAFLKLADGTDLGASLLERGAAQVDMESAGPERRATYSRLEAEARQAKRGLWGGPIVGNLASKVYHLPGGRFYHRVGPANRVLFTTELEALSAGYRPSTR
jgi:endonuclease YncB( thermonuclease family)